MVWGDIRKNIEVLQLFLSLKLPKDRNEMFKSNGKSKKTEVTLLQSNIFVKYGGNVNREHMYERKPKPACVSFQGNL